MKKLYSQLTFFTSLLLASNVMAQTIPNGDFTTRTVNPNGVTATFANWTGTGTIATEVGMNLPVAVTSSVIKTVSQGPCTAYSKPSGQCIQWGPDVITYTPQSQSISQTITPTSLPTKLYGKYSFTGDAGLDGYINVTISYNNIIYAGTLTTSNTNGVLDFEIPITSSGATCNKFKPCADYLSISLLACNSGCPSSANPSYTTKLVVDDLSFTPPSTTGIEDETIVLNSVYPNPTEGIINFSGDAIVTDLLGNKVAQGTNVINIVELNAGLYLLKTAKGVVKIVKQ